MTNRNYNTKAMNEAAQTPEQTMERRSFLKGAVCSAAVVLGASALSACSSGESGAGNASSGDYTFANTVKWDGEYDVIVIGFGAAGASTSRTAAVEGAKVLLIDKAPQSSVGGNSMFAGQFFINGNGNVEATKSYYRGLAGTLPLDEEIITVMGERVAVIEDNYVATYGLDKKDFVSQRTTPDAEFIKINLDFPFVAPMCPEYPEIKGSESISICALHDAISDGYMWQTMRQAVQDHADSIDVWFESPAKKLIQDPLSKTILGVQIERNGKLLNIRAKNGVVMTCGGFENNPEMRHDFLGVHRLAPMGTLYNTGDGIKMATEVGADLWHMDAWEGNMFAFGDAVMEYIEESDDGSTSVRSTRVLNHLLMTMFPSTGILVGSAGLRYMNEMTPARHGHFYNRVANEYKSFANPSPCFVIFDQADATAIKAEEAYSPSVHFKADTIAALAAATGIQAENLQNTVDQYNKDAQAEGDTAFGRELTTMRPFGAGPFYAAKLLTAMLNTQGGARRNAKAEILDIHGEPIPHLYSAGEFGGLTSNQYQGGGNLTECFIFGQIAGKNAAAVKDTPLPAYKVAPVESDLVYTPGKVSDL